MSEDDDTDCVEHVWRVREVLIGAGAWVELRCERCDAVRMDQPGAGALDAAKRAGIVPGVEGVRRQRKR